jgi:hypothetical protein
LAYIFDPISNTYIDDEDESLGNKLALSQDAEDIIKQIDEQFGPGTVFPASELPPKENPYKDFEDRNPAAEGGMIGGGVIEGEDYGDRSGFAEPKLIQGGSKTPVQFRGKYGVRSMLTIPANTSGYLGRSGEQLVFETEADARRFINQDLDNLNFKAKQSKKRSPVIEQRLKDIRNYVKELKKGGNKVYLNDVVEKFLGSKTVVGTGRFAKEQTNLGSRTTIKDNIREALGQEEYDKLIKSQATDPRITDANKAKFNKLVLDVNRGDLPITALGSEERGTKTNIKNYLTDANKKRFDKILSKLRAINSRISQPSDTLTEEGIEELKKTTTKNFDSIIKKYPSSIEKRTNIFKSGTRFYDAKSYILSLLARHVTRGGNLYKHIGGDTAKDAKFRNLKTNKIITLKNINLNSPEFKEAATVYNEFEKLKNTQIDNPITGEKISLNNAIKEGSGNKDYLIIDHQDGVKKNPLKNLNITTQKQNIGFELAGLSEDEKKRFYRDKVDFDTNLDRFTKYGQRLLTKGGYKKPKETIQDYRERVSNFAENVKNKMDASRMLTSKIPGGAIALTPLDFTMSMMAGVPLTDAAASAGSYLLKDPVIGRAVNIPLALREMTDYGSEEEMLQRATERREKGEDFLQGLLDKVKEGAGDQPEISPFQAAEGGRAGFSGGGAVGADDNFAKELEYYFTNPDTELPQMQTFKETMNPVTHLNDMIDPRNYPYYADILARSGVRVAEFGARILPALGKLASDLIQKPAFKVVDADSDYVQDYNLPGGKLFIDEFDMMDTGNKKTLEGTGIFTEFLQNITPTSMEKKLGLDKLIEGEKEKMIERGSTAAPVALGETVGLGVELAAPIFPGVKFLQSYAKARNLPADDVTKQIMEKEIDEVLSAKGTNRREFLKVSGAGGAVILAKMLGFGDDFGRVAKVAEKAAVQTANVGGKPAWFDALVSKIIREGDDITKQAATKDRETVHVMKLGEQEGVRVTQDLETGNITVDYDSPTNMGEQSVTLSYKAPEKLETGQTVPASFEALEVEPRGIRMGPDDYEIEFDGENIVEGIEDLNSDVSSLKQFATGQLDETDLKIRQEKLKKVQDLNENQVSQAEYLETKYGPGEEGSPYYQDFSDYD